MSKFFYLIGIMVIMMSCGKDIDLFIPRTVQAGVGNITNLKTRLAQDIESDISHVIQVPCEGNRIYQVDKDLVISIPADFVDLASYPCTNGYFDLHVTVCDTKGEILIAGIPTISESTLLESRVEFNLQIRQGNTHVKLAPGKKISVRVNDPDPRDKMELFYGNDAETEWIQADANRDTWDNVANAEWWLQDSSQQIITGFGYETFCDSLDWINVDVFVDVPEEQRTSVCVQLPEEFSNTNTAVFMVFNDYKSLLGCYGDAELKQFCEPYGATPIGFDVTFIVIAEMGDNVYLFDSKSTTITDGHVEHLFPVKTPYAEINTFIEGL